MLSNVNSMFNNNIFKLNFEKANPPPPPYPLSVSDRNIDKMKYKMSTIRKRIPSLFNNKIGGIISSSDNYDNIRARTRLLQQIKSEDIIYYIG